MPKKRFTSSDSVEIPLNNQNNKIRTKKKNFRFTPKQVHLLDLILDPENKIIFISGAAGTSKAQPLDAELIGPNGIFKMGDVKVGDLVLTLDGSSTKVTGVHPQGRKPIFLVKFDDGTSTECCGDHLWHTKTRHDRYTGKDGGVKTTSQIMDTLYIRGSMNHSIPLIKPVEFKAKKLPIDPYKLGKKLGWNDQEGEAFIPQEYLFAPIDDRMHFLIGLSAAGALVKDDRCCATFSSEHPRLIKDVQFMIQSLGGVARPSENGTKLEIDFHPRKNPLIMNFNSRNKKKPLYFPEKFIVDIIEVGEKECQCISVDHKSHLYATNNFIMTHNTYMALYGAVELLAADHEKTLLYVRSIVESAEKDLGSLPGDIGEKFDPFLMPMYDKLEEIVVPQDVTNLKTSGRATAIPVNFLRGASWNNKIIVADECFPDDVYIETDMGRVKFRNVLDCPKKYQVLSFNEKSQEFEFKKILNTFDRGERELSLLTLDNRSNISATRNHRFLCEDGWKRLDELKIGDAIISNSKNNHSKISLGEDQKDIVYGSILGDGGFEEVAKNSFRFKCNHGIAQYEYAFFKASMFDRDVKIIEKNGYSQKPAVNFYTKSFYLPCEKKDLKKYAIRNLSHKSLAIAWQDDGTYDKNRNYGCLWSCATSKEDNLLLVEKLNQMGYSCVECIEKKNNTEYYTVRFHVDGFMKMAEDIAPYIHKSMSYKIPDKFQQKISKYIWSNKFKNYSLRIVTDISLDDDINKVFDIEVEDNHNFIVSSCRGGDGTKIVAHNCQNFSFKEITTLITRVGEGAKLIICGDPMQSDIGNHRSGFRPMFNLFNDEDSKSRGIQTFQFTEEDIVRSEILKFLVKKINSYNPPV